MAAKPRIALVHNVLIHYRVPLFNLLAASKSWNFDFYFGAVHPWMNRFLSASDSYRPHFRYVVTKGLQLVEHSYFSPRLVLWLLRGRYDVFLGGPLSSPDCLITFLIAKSLRRPFILWEERWQSSQWFPSTIAAPVQLLIAKLADCIVVPGSKSFEYFRTALLGRNSTPCLVVAPNASELKKPSSSSVERFRCSHGIPRDKKVIVYFGRLLPEKGVDSLLQVFAMLERKFGDGVFLLVAGEGEERRKLQSLAKTLDLHNVEFTCSDIYEQAACLSIADVVVVPSTAARIPGSTRPLVEIWGLIVNEAASLGKPVVVTDVTGSAVDLVSRYGCGYVVKDRDCIGQYRAILSILADPKLAQRMGTRGIQATKEAFSFEKMVQGFNCAIREVLAKTANRRYSRGATVDERFAR